MNIRWEIINIKIKTHENNILFLCNDESTYKSIERNISNNKYQKTQIKPNKESLISQYKAIARAKYIFIDHDNEMLMNLNIENKKVIYIGNTIFNLCKIGLQNPINKKRQFNNLTYVTVNSLLQEQNLKEAFNLKDEQILRLGTPKNDILNSYKFKIQVDELINYNEQDINKIKIFCLIDKKYLERLSQSLDDKYVIYAYSILEDKEIKLVNVNYIKYEEISTFIKYVDINILNYNNYIIEALSGNKIAIIMEEKNEELNYPIEKFDYQICQTIEQLLKAIKSTKLIYEDKTKLSNIFNEYNNQSSGRKLVERIFGDLDD